MSVVDDLHRAREAYERREWLAAYRALSDLDQAHLQADDFAALAITAFLLGHRNDCVQALQRAYQAELEENDTLGAVRAAYWLALTLWQGGDAAIGNGWLARGQRLIERIDEDVVERGYLLERATFGHIAKGEFAEAAAAAPRVTEYGRRFGDPDLTAMGLHIEGRLTMFSGQVADGLPLLDEAMVWVLAGEVSPILSGVIYCSCVEACQQISDFGRMGEWTQALTIWCDGQPGLVAFTGQCAVHRGQLMRLHGAFRDAISELEHAAGRYAAAGGIPQSDRRTTSVARRCASGESTTLPRPHTRRRPRTATRPSPAGRCCGWLAADRMRRRLRSTASWPRCRILYTGRRCCRLLWKCS